MEHYQQTTEQVITSLQSDSETGLSKAEAQKRLAQYGPNELVERGKKSPFVIFLSQFKEVMVIVLLIAALVSAFLGEFTEVIVILAIVVLNAILGFTQEYRAEQAMEALKKMAVPFVRVRREGHVLEISSTELVPGDIVLLEAGNLIPADSRILESASLKVQEAALTGESEPVDKKVAAISGEHLSLGDRANMLFMGTMVTYGRGEAIVTETGMNTELGNIAGLIQDVEEDQTPLQRRLGDLGKTLAWVALGIIVVVVVTGLFRGTDLETLFLTGISLAVAAIPESLPAVVTITLALGSQRLLKRNALIRRLPAVETLGSVTVICSDKTGTLTENRMTVTILDVEGNSQDLSTTVEQRENIIRARLYADSDPDYAALSVLVRVGALCNDAVLETDENGQLTAIGDPTEGALVLAAEQLGFDIDDLHAEWPRVAEVPFTSERKRMTTIHKMSEAVQTSDVPWKGAPYVVMTKGAIDNLLDITRYVLVENEFVPLDDELRQRIEDANTEYAGKGQRVLGVAFHIWDSSELPEDLNELEADEVFVGLVSMMDPPRPEVKEAVATAKHAGIHPKMITGDHPLTAVQIAKDLTIAEGDCDEDGICLTGKELAKMPMEELERQVHQVTVYARVAPEHKLNIVNALQNQGEIVAMTGDGVNDAPALKQADIGVAMGITGTDVSKQAADMILLDDNFTTIVAAVEQGRVIFDNIRKFIKYTLSSNMGELFVMLLGPFLQMPLPLLPLQILWINLVTDGLPGLALAQEKGERNVMNRPPFEPNESVFSRGLGWEIIWIGTLMGAISLGLGYIGWLESPNGSWQTMVFTTMVLAQMGNALAIRSNRDSLFTIGVFSNGLMVFSVLSTIVLQLVLIYVPFFQNVFGTQPLTASEFGICVIASVVLFAVVEIYKWYRRRRK
jgi:Ca2+-transporting ATPase